jgi:hypothetical protein
MTSNKKGTTLTQKGINYTKKVCGLYYQDKIWKLYHQDGKSIRQIADYINKQCIPHSKFAGITLSKTKIHEIIKKYNNREQK